MTVKAAAEQIESLTSTCLPALRQRLDRPEVEDWFNLHGWTSTDEATQRRVVCQGLLNAILRETFPDLRFFPCPLDFLCPTESLTTYVAGLARASDTFNFWGELYTTLVHQSMRRRIGQFWTEEHVADWMAGWLLRRGARRVADIGCGAGNFLLKTAQRARDARQPVDLTGLDVSPILLNIASAAMAARRLPAPALTLCDFLASPLPSDADAVICNPPYTRHHHIDESVKAKQHAFLKGRLRLDVSRLSGLAFYFLLKAIAEMPTGAPAAFIVPMEVLDARYGRAAKRVLCQHTALSAIIHFSSRMNAFERVDVGASILLFVKGYTPGNVVRHVTLEALPSADELLAALDSTTDRQLPFGSLSVRSQDDLIERPKWFILSDPAPELRAWQDSGIVVPLKRLAKVVRGIATGANEFFALTTEEVERRGLAPFVVRTIQRNREIQALVLDEAAWQSLSVQGRRVWLLYLNGDHALLPPEVRDYLAEGEARGYHRRSLIGTRRVWYWMEQRDVPAIFFTILTRGNPRFILNRAGVRPLNMFSLLYPHRTVVESDAVEILWALLNTSFSLSRLHSVSRTYGGKTLKVEPRELDNLPVVNPLALPQEVRNDVRAAIARFSEHRLASRFTAEMDRIVASQLASPQMSRDLSQLPVQLQLLEPKEPYP